MTAAPRSDLPGAWLPVVVLALLVGPHWLVWRDQFDGAAITFAALTGHHDGFETALRNANWPVALAFHKTSLALGALTGAPYLLFVKIALSALLVGLYLELRALAADLLGLAPREARMAALLASASPVLYTLVSSQIVPILLCIWLVFAGHRLFRREQPGPRAAGLALLVVSFQLNSNLVFALALEVVWLARLGPARLRRLPASLVLLGAAVAVYATMRWLLPPAQLFTEYNQLLKPWRPDDLRRIVKATLMFLTWGVIPLGAVLIAALCLAVQGGWRLAACRTALPEAARQHGPLVVAAAFLCASAAFPYVVVGKGPPLFTLVAIGEGLTEQVLRAAHAGPLAPTWANSSGRHALLYGAAMGLLAFGVGRFAWQALGGDRREPRGLAGLTLVMLLAWVLPAYWNKLQTQFVEQSLVHGLRTVPPAPAGVVELSYRPVTDWLVWTQSAGVILHEAWGQAPYWPSFYSVPAYRTDMLWQYHVYLRQTGGLGKPAMQHYLGVHGLANEDCITRLRAVLPPFDPAQVLLAGLRPTVVSAATIERGDVDCQPGRVLPNPTPDKKLIP